MSQPEFQSVIVIGAGLIGTASAYALTKSGFQVTLVEASEAPAMGASFANGGMITPSMSDPWNGPGIGGHILSAFFNPDSGMRVHPRAISSLLGWGVRFILNSSPRHFRQATRSNFFLANYSLSVTKAWRQELDLGYDAVDRGTLKVFATQDAMAGPLQIAQDLSPDGLQYQVLDMQEILAMQPALAAVKDRIAGAIYYPDDSVGNARLFTCELQSRAQALGCKVHFNTQVTSIAPQDSRVTVVARSGQALHADCLVVAAAIDSLDLLDPLGLHIPIRPAKGYSVSFPVAPDHLPRYAVVDDARHIAVTPIGDQASRCRDGGICWQGYLGFGAANPHAAALFRRPVPAVV